MNIQNIAAQCATATKMHEQCSYEYARLKMHEPCCYDDARLKVHEHYCCECARLEMHEPCCYEYVRHSRQPRDGLEDALALLL